MTIRDITQSLLSAGRSYFTKRRQEAQLRECDPRTLKDIGLRWERGRLVALNPDREGPSPATATTELDASRATPNEALASPAVCPRCGAELA